MESSKPNNSDIQDALAEIGLSECQIRDRAIAGAMKRVYEEEPHSAETPWSLTTRRPIWVGASLCIFAVIVSAVVVMSLGDGHSPEEQVSQTIPVQGGSEEIRRPQENSFVLAASGADGYTDGNVFDNLADALAVVEENGSIIISSGQIHDRIRVAQPVRLVALK